ncbi:MAG: hypothetical protein ABSG46_11820, partial [Candidatus Binataceae bacterium]
MLDAQIARGRPVITPITFGVAGRVVRAGFLLLLLAAELIHFGVPLLPSLNPTLRGWWWPVIWNGRPLGEAVLGGVIVTVFLSWPVFREEFDTAGRSVATARLNFWLAIHLLCAALAAGWLGIGMAKGAFRPIESAGWFLSGLLILSATAITWCATAVAPEFWVRWMRRTPGAFAAGAAIGIFT